MRRNVRFSIWTSELPIGMSISWKGYDGICVFVLRFLNVHDSFDIPGEQPALVQYTVGFTVCSLKI